jgi:membrane protein DedA with SNARE-associated domain
MVGNPFAVEEFLLSLPDKIDGGASYAIVFGILVACGLGVPLPEDVSLILGGFLAYEGKADLVTMMGVGLAGIIVGDSIIFFAGRRFGTHVGATPKGWLARVVTPEKRAKVAGLFQKHGEKIVMIARFAPGVRAVTFFTAGSVHMKYTRFILFDGLAALVSAPVFVYLGHYFGAELNTLIDGLRKGQTRVFVGVGVAVALWLVYRYWKARRNKAQAAAALPSASVIEAASPHPAPVPAPAPASAPTGQGQS